MLCNMPTYVLVPESFVHNPKLLSLLGPTHCFSLEALNSQIKKGVVQKFSRANLSTYLHLILATPLITVSGEDSVEMESVKF